MIAAVVPAPTSTVRRVLMPDAFRPDRDRQIEDTPWKFGSYLEDYLPQACWMAGESLVVLRNGHRVPKERWKTTRVLPGDEIGVVLWPADPATIFLAAVTIISLIVSTASAIDAYRRAKIQGHHMARRQAAMAQHMQDSAIYGWDGVQNTTQPGRPILVVYGRHRVGGQVIYAEPYKDKRGKNSLDMTLCVSQGEIEEIETDTIEINDQPLSEYKNVSVETKVGTNDQTAATNHSPGLVVQGLQSPGTEVVAGGGAVTVTTTGEITNYEVDLSFPNGLRMSSHLNRSAEAVFQIRHRVSPAGAFSTPVTVKSGWRWTTGSFMLTYRSGPLTKDTYDIEITRLANATKSGAFGGTVTVDAGHSKSFLNQVREYDNVGLIYPNLALLHISAIASDQVNGVMPTVTAIVKGMKVDLYTKAPGDTIAQSTTGVIDDATGFSDPDIGDTQYLGFLIAGVAAGDLLVITDGGTAGSSVEATYTIASVDSDTELTFAAGTFPATGTGVSYRIETAVGVFTTAFSRNPAWCILDLLTNAIYGAGAHLEVGPWDGVEDTGDLDIQAFIDAAAFCDTLVDRRPTTENPLDSGALAATTVNTAQVLLSKDLVVGIQVDDTLVIEDGDDFGSYRIDSIVQGSGVANLSVSGTDGSAVSFAGDAGKAWHIDNSRRRAQCDYVIDGQTNIEDAVSSMANPARLAFVQGFGQYMLIADEIGTPVAVFGSGNIIEGSYRHEYLAHRSLANKVEVQFLNAALNYQQDIVQLEDPDVLINNEDIIPDPQEAYSATSLEQVQMHAKYHYLSNRHERELIEFETSIEGLPVRVFDVVAYVHEISRVDEFFTGRSAAGTELLTVELGQAVTIPAGTVDIYIQTHDPGAPTHDGVLRGTIQQSEGDRVDVVTVPEWNDLGTDVTHDNGPTALDPWILVPRPANQEEQRWWKVTSVTLGQEGRRKIRAVSYRDAVYNEDPVPADLVAV